MTHREAFETAKAHLLAQGERATRSTPTEFSSQCAYRAEDGKKCAIGCLIPSAEYQPTFEGMKIGRIVAEIPSLKGLDPGFLNALQNIHDHNLPHQWVQELQDFEEFWSWRLGPKEVTQ